MAITAIAIRKLRTLEMSKEKKGDRNLDPTPRTVLVATFRCENAEWIKSRRLYNLPIPKCGKVSFHDRISRIVLIAEGFSSVAYSAKLKGVVERDWLKSEGYKVAPKNAAHGERYALYELNEKLSAASVLSDASADVFVSSSRCPNVRIDAAFYAKPYPKTGGKSMPYVFDRLKPYFRKWRSAMTFSPVQEDFFDALIPSSSLYRNRGAVKYRVASLFAGCGGLDLGFQGGFEFLGKKYARTGFGVCWANEINPAACKTYSRNFGVGIVCGDIKDAIKTMPSDVDVVMGGFPCQDISINGKMLGIKGRRSCLYTYIIDAVKKAKPKVFVAENVGSLLLKQNEYSLTTILHDFKSLGYDVTYHVYHAEDYGVPQTRERVIFVGTRRDVRKFVAPPPLKAPAVTAGEALRDLERVPQNKEFSHVWSMAAPSGEQGSRRLIEDRPGYTIRAECHGNIQFHYRLSRRISMREAARIQSFPDTFVFPCGIRETERQIGNAVPPVLAWHVAMAVREAMKGAS